VSAASTSLIGASPAHDAQRGEATRLTERTSRGQLRRVFLPHEDALIRTWRAGAMRTCTILRALKCGHLSLYRRVAELGFDLKPTGRPRTKSRAQLAPIIAAPAADPSPAVPGRTTGQRDGQRSSQAAPCGQLAPAGASAAGGGLSRPSPHHTGRKREFTAAEDDVIRDAVAGRIRVDDAIAKLGTGAVTFYRRADELGLATRKHRASETRIAGCPPGWFPIAHGGQGKWRPYDGSPVSIEDARAYVARGLGTMAQKRVDGAFDLLFRAHHPATQREPSCPTT
jgi:hypothetical protein